jgi:hypothetical protein
MKRFAVLWPFLVVAWDILFWNNPPGLNVLLFAILIISILLARNPKAWKRKTVLISGTLTLLAAVMVVLHGPGWGVFAFAFSLLIFSAFALEEKFRSAIYPLLQAALDIVMWPVEISRRRRNSPGKAYSGAPRFLYFVVLPVIVAIVFFALYSAGNPHFGKLFSSFTTWLNDHFGRITFGRFLFFVLGGMIAGGLMILYPSGLISPDQNPDRLQRVRRTSTGFTRMTALRQHLRFGIIILALLNGLLLINNIIDVQKVWNHFIVPEKFSLKKFVHEGTWVLMFSIGLSILVVLFLFRGNVHFYSGNKWLKRLSYFWIGQNIFLAFSLFKRNYEYIDYHGLAYGRIVVIFMLIFVIILLGTALWKIIANRTGYYLLRVNSWAAYLLIVGISLFNWDKIIVNYNLRHWNVWQIDVDFYLEIGNEMLPVLKANEDLIYNQIQKHNENNETWIYFTDASDFRNTLYWRSKEYIARRNERSWLSWNYADAKGVYELRICTKIPNANP